MENNPSYLRTPLIIDMGSSRIKAGLGGQEKPKLEFPCYIGEPKYQKIYVSSFGNVQENDEEKRERFVGYDCDKYMGVIKLSYPIKHGVFSNKEDIKPIFDYLYEKLEITSEDIPRHPVLIAEPLLNPTENRMKIAEILFEAFNLQALIFVSQPILSLFSTSVTSGAVLESGDGVSQSCIIYEGYSIPNSYMRYNFGGSDVTENLRLLLKKKGYNFDNSDGYEIVKNIKESLCYTEFGNDDSVGGNMGNEEYSDYVLPDGVEIKIGKEKKLATEILFDSTLNEMEYPSLPEMLTSSINKGDIDIRLKLFGNILLSGGNAYMKGMKERFHKEVKKLATPNSKVRLHVPSKPDYCCWVGGNVISSLEVFKQMWVTKGNWMEKGRSLLNLNTI